ncbi:hypothetical protein [Cellulomonas soli]
MLVVNPLRAVRVPWAALIDVRTRYSLTLVTPTGQVRAWAAPGPGRHELAAAGQQDLTGLPTSTYDSRGAVGFGDLLSTPRGSSPRRCAAAGPTSSRPAPWSRVRPRALRASRPGTCACSPRWSSAGWSGWRPRSSELTGARAPARPPAREVRPRPR